MRFVLGTALAAGLLSGPAAAGGLHDVAQAGALVEIPFGARFAAPLRWSVGLAYDASALARAGIAGEAAGTVEEREHLRFSPRARLPIAEIAGSGAGWEAVSLSGLPLAGPRLVLGEAQGGEAASGGSRWGWYVAGAVLATGAALALVIDESGDEAEDVTNAAQAEDAEDCQVEPIEPIGSGGCWVGLGL